MIDHCIAVYKKKIREKQYQYYITDALKAIAENTSASANRSTLSSRFYDIVNPSKEPKEQNADRVISNIKNKITLIGKEVS